MLWVGGTYHTKKTKNIKTPNTVQDEALEIEFAPVNVLTPHCVVRETPKLGVDCEIQSTSNSEGDLQCK